MITIEEAFAANRKRGESSYLHRSLLSQGSDPRLCMATKEKNERTNIHTYVKRRALHRILCLFFSHLQSARETRICSIHLGQPLLEAIQHQNQPCAWGSSTLSFFLSLSLSSPHSTHTLSTFARMSPADRAQQIGPSLSSREFPHASGG